MSQPTREGSSLAQFKVLSPNTSSRNGARVKFFIPHHAAGNISPRNLLSMPRFATNQFGNRGASCMYAIRDKEIGQGALETQRTWTSSSRWADERGIAIEIANSRNDSADWPMTDQSVQTTAELAVDCMKFYGYDTMAWYDDPQAMGMQNEMVLKVHRMFQATSCPGPWFMRNMQAFIDVVNALYQGKNARFVSIDARTAQCVIDGQLPEAVAPLPHPSAPVEANPTFAVGDIVQFAGGPHFSSATASSHSGNRTAGTARVTAIAARGAQTVHLIGQPGGSNVHGWVAANRVKPLLQTPTEPPRPQAPPPQEPAPDSPPAAVTEFRIRSTAQALNVRSGPGTEHRVVKTLINDRNVYTIVEVQGDWGRLKSGVGWLALQFTERV